MTKAKEIDEETVKALKENLRYDPETGLFWWTKPLKGRTLSKPAGGLNPAGHLNLKFNGEIFKLHRLSFTFMGETVPEVVDHVNGVRNDNRWCNLRESCNNTNQHNRGMCKNNKAGYKGVYPKSRGGKWGSKIRAWGNVFNLGTFDCPKEAHKAYCDAADKMHKEYKNYG